MRPSRTPVRSKPSVTRANDECSDWSFPQAQADIQSVPARPELESVREVEQSILGLGNVVGILFVGVGLALLGASWQREKAVLGNASNDQPFTPNLNKV